MLGMRCACAQCPRSYTLFEMLSVFKLFAVPELSVALSDSSPVVPCIANNFPHRARHAHPLLGSRCGLWSVALGDSLSVDFNIFSPEGLDL